jgi:hypothetical protein
MWVKPTDDKSRAIVRDPKTLRPVPVAGMEVPDTSPYYLRRIAQGDLIRVVSGGTSTGVSSGGTHVSSGATIGSATVISGGTAIVSGGSPATPEGSITSGGSAA